MAYALPYRRFVAVLADVNARLGADVGRYSFIVVDLHHLLLAGLPAHFESDMPSQAVVSNSGAADWDWISATLVCTAVIATPRPIPVHYKETDRSCDGRHGLEFDGKT